ncbi:MAG: hypothetical protein ABEJ08_04755 [Halobacteriaceae archaeon]
MSPDPDELAGVVDLFGALTPGELETAVAEWGARTGAEGADVAETVASAREQFALVAVDPEAVGGLDAEAVADQGENEADGDGAPTLLVAGPTAFPTLPDGAEDLPHVLDIDRRSVDRAAAGAQAMANLRGAAARAVQDGDRDRIARLLDVTYEIESWAPVEAGEVREHLADALDRTG